MTAIGILMASASSFFPPEGGVDRWQARRARQLRSWDALHNALSLRHCVGYSAPFNYVCALSQ